MDGNSPDGGEGGQKPHGVLGREPEDVLALADDDKSLLVLVVGVDVLQGYRGELRRELRGEPDGERHPSLQLRVGTGAVILLVIIVPGLCREWLARGVTIAPGGGTCLFGFGELLTDKTRK